MILTVGHQNNNGAVSLKAKTWIIMKLTIVLLFFFTFQVSARSDAQKITIVKNNVHLAQVFKDIERQTGYHFFYDKDLIQKTHLVDIKLKGATIEQALSECLKGQQLTYAIVKNTIVIQAERTLHSQLLINNSTSAIPISHDIHGKVSDSKGGPMAGVSVTIKGESVGTTTDNSGNYSITVPDNAILIFSYVGFNKEEVSVNGRNVINISLKASETSMDQVVVIGYGTQKKSEITGAISSVKGKDISTATSTGLQGALQGRVAGVIITPTTGQPGGALDMTIRGVATFGNSNPLFVIDGVPVLTEATSRDFNPLAGIPLENIESIQILKDASAAAIYGARAANGVVIITTNRGDHTGKNQIQFKASRGVSKVSKFIPLLNSAQYIDYATEAFQNAGKPLPVSLTDSLRQKNLQTNTDWQKSAFKPATIENYFLNIYGGNTNANYSVSGGYLNQGGNLPNSDFKRYSVNVNSDFNIGEKKKLKVGETIGLSQSIWKGTFDPTSLNMRQLLQQSPTVPVYNAADDGGFDGPRLQYSPVGRQNTIGVLTLTQQKRIENRVLGSLYANYDILPGLSDRFSVSGDLSVGRDLNFIPTYNMGQYVNTLATLTESRFDRSIYYITNTTTYQKTFNKIHKITALIGFSQQHSWQTNTTVQVRNFQSNNLQTVAAGFEQRNITGDETGWALQSQMARLSYGYKDKINVMGVVRRDGSSRFGINNRYGVFPSISANWIISKEQFMDNMRAVSDLKLRASYGKVGSQDISDFAQYATIQPNVNYVFGDAKVLTPGATFVNMGNSNLKWEVTAQTDLGIDLGLFDQKLSFVFDYYVKNTNGILVKLPIPTTSGIRRTNGPFVNAGSVQNKGIEFTATYQNRLSDDINYSLSGNISANRNKVISLNSNQPIIAQLTSGTEQSISITQQGDAISEFYGYVMDGIFKDQADIDKSPKQPGSAPGDAKFKDLNHDGVINASDQTVLGSPFPKFIYGFNANLNYKNFDLVLFVTGKSGQYLYNLVWATLNEGVADNNATTEQLKRWTPNNTNTNIPRAVEGNPGLNERPSSRFVQNASYMRVQNIQIGYNLGKQLSHKFKLTNCRFYISAQNLFTLTKYPGYNPEIGTLTVGSQSSLTRGVDYAMVPIPRIIEGGIQINL